MDRLNLVWDNIKRLGSRKLTVLGIAFLLVVSVLAASAYYLSRPSFDTLYAGLDREDVTRIGSVLKGAGIPFDVNPEGNLVSVAYGQTAQARMLLAEHGLPQSANAGYELFDKVGALGLTSFMQEVTRVRALEGELARTIQLIRGIKAARVHIVMPDEGSFRRVKQPPSASVIIRTEAPDDSRAAQAIRHLVAASLPGMNVDQVTVLNTDGMILSSADGELSDAAPVKTLALEKAVSKDLQDNIRKTLSPYLRLTNFQVSVRARINTDRRQTSETIYDPESKVERSVRTMKENSTSQNSSNTTTTSVERNIPQERTSQSDGRPTNDESKKSEEVTNYDISTKTISTVSGGYNIESLSVAVLINRAAFGDPGKSINQEQIDKKLSDIEKIVISASGLRKDHGDTLKVSIVDFNSTEQELAPVEGLSFSDQISRHISSIVNATTAVAVTSLVLFFGVKPAMSALLAESPSLSGSPTVEAIENSQELASPDPIQSDLIGFNGAFDGGVPRLAVQTPKERLEELVQDDAPRAAGILRQWLTHDDSA